MKKFCLFVALFATVMENIDTTCLSNNVEFIVKVIVYGPQDLIDAILAPKESRTVAQQALIDQEIANVIAEVLGRNGLLSYCSSLNTSSILKIQDLMPGLIVTNIYLEVYSGYAFKRDNLIASGDELL